MKIDDQLVILCKEMRKLLLSGNNCYIFIDVKRSQITYFKYVLNKNMARVNFREGKYEESIGIDKEQ